MTAVMLAVTVMCGTVMGSYQEAQAAGLSAGALQYGLDLSFLESLFMAGGLSLGLDMLLKTQNDINNWDWGDVLDSPASQGQIDSANEKIESLYNNAVKDWYDKHGGSSKPTPTPMITEPPAPGVTPPVTVAPINPDDVTIPDDWATMKKNATDKGVLAMGAATAYCVKEAVNGWWNKFVNDKTVIQDDFIPNWDSDYFVTTSGTFKQVGKAVSFSPLGDSSKPIGMGYFYFTIYVSPDATSLKLKKGNYYDDLEDNLGKILVTRYDVKKYNNGQTETVKCNNQSILRLNSPVVGPGYGYSFSSDLPVYVDNSSEPLNRNDAKKMIWPSTDTKDDYNNNNPLPTPSYPNIAVPSIKLPSLDEIKDLWKQGSDDEENRPTYVTNFITNHTVQPTPEPEPTKKPEVNPNPGGGTDPDPNPTPSTTPAVNPDPGGGTDPDPNPDPDPDNPDPDNPDPTPEEEASPYKADLREIFPFCIPFDLIHLFKVFDAEPEAPVFKFPLDLELDNPWTDEKVVDYHHEFEFDFSDYEDLIKLLRIIQIVAFITGLMMITRQQMIKG